MQSGHVVGKLFDRVSARTLLFFNQALFIALKIDKFRVGCRLQGYLSRSPLVRLLEVVLSIHTLGIKLGHHFTTSLARREFSEKQFACNLLRLQVFSY